MRCPGAAIALVSWLPLLAGCGGARFDGRSFVGEQTRYDVAPLPPAWRPIDLEGAEADIAFHEPALGATIHTDSSCDPRHDIPLRALTTHLLIGATRREVLEERLVPLDGREALRTHVRFSLDGVPREAMLVVLKKDGCIYDLALLAPPGPRFERARADFERFLQGFHARRPVR